MNFTYRSTGDDKSGTFIAACDNSTGKKSSPGANAVTGTASFALKGLAVSLMLAFGPGAYALPVGGVVAAGGASISSAAGSTTINQSTQNAAINWQSFSIGQGEAVQFMQPNSSSVALNRVLGADASSILGSMSANGKVFLVNPNGILFGKGAQVNVGGLVASTLNITDSDFMAGRYQFAGSSGASVLNQGSINADGGYVALLGANVGNDGVISARLGTVALAAGNAITLDVAGDGLLNVTVSQGAVDALVQNGGLIQADGGQVLLTAQSAGNLLQSAVNNTGVIQAQTIENHNGTIRLLGDMQSGTVSVSGTLDASGTGAGQTGGSVTVTGHHVGLFGTTINASGDAGGGTVLIGGDYQGKNPAVQNATATYMSADSTINADAITNGNGGKVILWSDESTRAYGSIMARGGASGGNGGLIETSAHWLDVAGIRIDASAANGASGMWLLDPADITISGAVTAGIPVAPVGGVYAPNSGETAVTLNTTDLRTALQAGGGTNVTITTTNTGVQGAPPSGRGDITIASALTWVVGGAATLTLNAIGDVNINAAVSMTNGNLVVCCGRDINVRAAITGATAGSVSLSAGRDISVVRSIANPATDITVTNGNISMCAGRDIILSNTFNQPTALITINDSNISVPHGLGLTPGLVLSAGNAATGPGIAGGTVSFTPLTKIALTKAGANPLAVNVSYNPTSYTLPTDYAPLFTLVGTSPLSQRMLVYPGGADKIADTTTTAVFTSFKPDINGLVPGGGGLTLVAGIGNSAEYDTALPGVNKLITYSGYTLGGATAGLALPVPCCSVVTRTTGTITAAPPPPPPPIPPILPVPLPPFVPVPPVDTTVIDTTPIALASIPVALEGAEMLGREREVQEYVPAWSPTVVEFRTPPELLSLAPPVVVPPPPPPVVAPPVYVPPVLPPKQDRN
ncbi:MAG: filamentous hemagglutinin N-terminal domain-containing protein [Sulfuritalea sp.]|jgi:filamentous hemagglutinin family protein|nr:filamentous hemagglutinin N-terminal domain-containing protein [Sulfuritalea sp.]